MNIDVGRIIFAWNNNLSEIYLSSSGNSLIHYDYFFYYEETI